MYTRNPIKPSKWLVESYQKQVFFFELMTVLKVKSRQWYLNLITGNKTERVEWGWLYNNLAPEIFCPELIKVGTTNDGGKWMCSPSRLVFKFKKIVIHFKNAVFGRDTLNIVHFSSDLVL